MSCAIVAFLARFRFNTREVGVFLSRFCELVFWTVSDRIQSQLIYTKAEPTLTTTTLHLPPHLTPLRDTLKPALLDFLILNESQED